MTHSPRARFLSPSKPPAGLTLHCADLPRRNLFILQQRQRVPGEEPREGGVAPDKINRPQRTLPFLHSAIGILPSEIASTAAVESFAMPLLLPISRNSQMPSMLPTCFTARAIHWAKHRLV